MGFESSQMARRRMAVLAASNGRVQDALSADLSPVAPPTTSTALARQLDALAHEIVATPGAGGALLAAYAAQARALALILEAAKRAGTSPLPAAVLATAQEALEAAAPLPGLVIG